MGIDYSGSISKGKKIINMSYDIEKISTGTTSMEESIGFSYKGEDSKILISVLEQVKSEISSIANELNYVGDNVISTANVIRREEKQREEAMRRARTTV